MIFTLIGLMAAIGVADSARADEAAIRAMIETKYAKENSCDQSYAEDYVTDDATEILPNFLRAFPKEPANEVEAFREFCAAGGKTRNDPQIHSVTLVSEDVALVTGSGYIAVTRPDGVLEYDGEYSFSEVFVRKPEGWRVRHLHVAPIVPDLPTVPPRE